MDKIWLKHYPKDVPAEIDFQQYHSVIDIFREACEKYRHKPAFTNLGHVITYDALDNLSRDFAAYLENDLHLKRGDRVAIMLPNLLQYPIVLFGLLRAGCIAVNFNPLYTPTELEHQLNDAQTETIVILANFASTLEKALPQTKIKNIIITELADCLPLFKRKLINFAVKYIKRLVPKFSLPNTISFLDCINRGKTLPLLFDEKTLKFDDIAFLQYTGGTTGVAKGAMLTHRNIVANMLQGRAWMSDVLQMGKETVITPLPLYHIFSLTVNCLIFLELGGLNVLITNPRDIPNVIKEIKKFKFTAMTGVNTLFNAMLNHADFNSIDFSHLHLSIGGGMAVQQIVAERWEKETHCALLEGYGLTEASPAVSMTPLNLEHYNGSIGLPLPSTDISIRDDDGKELSIGEVGELCVKGPQVMLGYWNNPEETKNVLTSDGWLHTGDIAKIDHNGFIYIVDRKKDMINVSGFKVFPNEIESVIASHPGVREVGVVGIVDPVLGEEVKAVIVKKDPNLTADDIRKYCHQKLTGYKVPKIIEFRDSLPKTSVGKILRRELR
ncbi:MAG TPA: AMP-binding protein [Gammaproteobacteria bacterium]|nr:AMP-binding protein [Gammaproteobacteria bacterium]